LPVPIVSLNIAVAVGAVSLNIAVAVLNQIVAESQLGLSAFTKFRIYAPAAAIAG
jgi:hypothetical protein